MAMPVAPASTDFSLLSFVADSRALVMLFSNGTVQVSDQNSRAVKSQHSGQQGLCDL